MGNEISSSNLKLSEVYSKLDVLSLEFMIENLYDVDTGSVLNITKLQEIYESGFYYFHGTKSCRAIHILRDGFKLDVIDGEFMMGNGIYMTNNLNNSLSFGFSVFICTIKYNNRLNVPYDTWNDIPENNDEYDAIFQPGKIDRFNNQIHATDSLGLPYDEIVLKNPENIKIKYILILKPDYSDLSYSLGFAINCVLDLKMNEFYDSNVEKTQFIKDKLWYIEINFQTVLHFLNFKSESVMLKDKTVIPKLIENVKFTAHSSKQFNSFKSLFVLAVNVYDSNNNMIESTPNTKLYQENNFEYKLDPVYLMNLQ